MTVNVNNSFVGTAPDGGVLFAAPTGTALPETANADLDEAFEDHGAIAEDGVTVTPERSTTDVKSLGGKDFRTVQTEYSETITLSLLEDDNDAVIKTVYGERNVEVDVQNDGSIRRTIYHTASPLPIKSYIIKTIDEALDKVRTYVIERGQVTNVERTADVASDVTRTNITIKTYSSTNPEYQGAYIVELREDNGEELSLIHI